MFPPQELRLSNGYPFQCPDITLYCQTSNPRDATKKRNCFTNCTWGNGLCNDGVCNCNKGFGGPDCSVSCNMDECDYNGDGIMDLTAANLIHDCLSNTFLKINVDDNMEKIRANPSLKNGDVPFLDWILAALK